MRGLPETFSYGVKPGGAGFEGYPARAAPFSNKEELLNNVESMEAYLGTIIAEYESSMPLIRYGA